MLKRSKKILLLILGVLLLSGCKLKSEVNMNINEDKSMNLKYIAVYDDELINAMMSMNESSSLEEVNEVKEYTDEEQRKFLNENFLKGDEPFASLEEDGFVIEEYQDDIYMGYSITKNIENIENFVGEITDFSLANYEDLNSRKMFTKNGNVYKGKILFENAENEEAAETYGIDLEYIFTLTLPNKVITSNATTVSEDGKTLTWNLVNSNIDAIEFEFEFPSFLTIIKNNMFIIAGIAIVIILIIVVLITLIINKSKKNNKDVKNGNSVMNEQDSVVSPQSEIQPIMSQDSVVSLQPEIQPITPQDTVVSSQPEIQPVMPQDSVVNPQSEIQPIMSRDLVMTPQPEIQPVMPQDTVVSSQPEIQPVMPQDTVVSSQPEIQTVMPQDSVVYPQSEIQPIMSRDSVMTPQPEIQSVMPQDTVVSLQPEIQPITPQDTVVSSQAEIQTVMPQDSVVYPQPEIQPIMSQEPLVNIQPEPQKPIVIPDIEVQPVVSEQPINSEPLFPQDIVPPRDYK